MQRRDLLNAGFAWLAGAAAQNVAPAAESAPASSAGTPPRFGDARDWFFERRFGLFIHWGIYSVGGWHEQHMYRRRLGRADYRRFMEGFRAERYSPDAWLDLAAEAGMEYLTFTTKHVDGFCMWDSALTDFKVTRTPAARDVLRELADACHRRSVPLCLYYSCADMNHPNYPNAGRSYELPAPEPGDSPDLHRYLDYVRGQMQELCTHYGPIHGIWWDANVLKHRDPSINDMIRRLQPAAVINDRGYGEGDFGTPERDYDKQLHTHPVFARPTEACDSVGRESWGWREDEDYFTDAYLIRSIHSVLARGGNFLLNVGPKPDGTIPDAHAAILRRIGAWVRTARPALWNARPLPGWTESPDVLTTAAGSRVYVHVVREPATSTIVLAPQTRLPRRARLLNTGADLQAALVDLPSRHQRPPSNVLCIRGLPADRTPSAGWVIELQFDGDPPTPPLPFTPLADRPPAEDSLHVRRI